MDLPTNPELSEASPWVSIWTKPRPTMRRIIVDTEPTKNVALLASLYGIFQALNGASSISLGDELPLLLIFLICVILGPIGGLIGLYFGGWIFSWSGKKLGGTAGSEMVRAALAWGAVPGIFGQLVYWGLGLLTYGGEMFTTYAPKVEAYPMPLMIGYLIMLMFALWGTVVLLKCLGEVHGFSAWRAWGATIVGGLVIAAPIVLLSICLTMFLALGA